MAHWKTIADRNTPDLPQIRPKWRLGTVAQVHRIPGRGQIQVGRFHPHVDRNDAIVERKAFLDPLIVRGALLENPAGWRRLVRLRTSGM